MIVLDTHIWLWWIARDVATIGKNRMELIDSEDIVAVSAISCFEVAWLERHKRIQLPNKREDWFNMAIGGSGIELLPIIPDIACMAVDLPEHHTDPQDRIIIATSIYHNASVMSLDKKFSLYEELENRLI